MKRSSRGAPHKIKKDNSVKSLTTLYTIVIGLSLTTAISVLIDKQKGLSNITLSAVLLFLAFIVTLFPFYHGALRHLDDAYIENENNNIKDGALLFDVILLFLHGVIFAILALLINNPNQFAWIMICLFLIDIVWGIFVFFGASSGGQHKAEKKWTIINTVFVAVLLLYLWNNDIYINQTVIPPDKISSVVLCLSFIRSLADYLSCRSFYFPSEN